MTCQLKTQSFAGNSSTSEQKMEPFYSMLQTIQPSLDQHLMSFQHTTPYAHYIPLWSYQPVWNPISIPASYSSCMICVPVSIQPVMEEFPTQLTPCVNGVNESSFLDSSVPYLPETPDCAIIPTAVEIEEIVGTDQSQCQDFQNTDTIPICNPHGNTQWFLKNGINVEVSNHGSFLISCGKIVVAIGLDGKSLAVIHPSARVWYHREKVHVTMLTNGGYRRQVKIWHKGVSFSANLLSVAYLLDVAGVRTSIEQFRNINGSTIRSVFEDNPEAVEVDMPCIFLQPGHWQVGEYEVKQREDGTIKVRSEAKNIELRLCPSSGTLQVHSPSLYLTASCTSSGRGRHVYVRRIQVREYQECYTRRMHFDGEHLVVRDGGQEAGIDITGKLSVERDYFHTYHSTSPKAA